MADKQNKSSNKKTGDRNPPPQASVSKRSAGGEATATGPVSSRADIVAQSEAVAQQIGTMSSAIIEESEKLRRSVDESELAVSLQQLRNATTIFKSMADSAVSQIRQDQSQVVWGPTSPAGDPAVPSSDRHGCGCHGCGDECKPKCCIQVYISALRVVQGQVGDKRMELLAAVQAGQTWGLTPRLASFLSIPEGRGLELNDPIANFCVPCGECMTIPLHAEVMETSDGTWLGSHLEGRQEVGTAQGTMSLRCDCETSPVSISVGLSSGGKTKGVVAVEVSARSLQPGCC